MFALGRNARRKPPADRPAGRARAAAAPRRRPRWPAALALGALIAAPWAHAQTNPQIDEFLARLNTNIAIIAHQSGGGVSRSCAHVMSSSVDLDAIARDAAADLWDRMSAQERDAYRAVIGQRAIRECARQHHDNTGAPLTLVGVRQGQGGDWLLATRSSHAGKTHNVIWRLRGEAGSLRAVDILFDGRSTILTLRDETKTLLDGNNGNIAMMINALAPRSCC